MEEVVLKESRKTMHISLVIGCIEQDIYKCEDLIKNLGKNIEYFGFDIIEYLLDNTYLQENQIIFKHKSITYIITIKKNQR